MNKQDIKQHPFTQPDASIPHAVTVPPSYDGDLFRPKDTQAYPGKRPAIVLMHGRGLDKCSLYWAARLLAAHGYVTLTLSVPNHKDPVPPHILATKRAINYLRSTANPFAAYIDGDNIGLAGHSLGATAVCYIQGVSPYVKAIVALDNLKEFRHGDPGEASDCDEDMTDPNTPRVPALGMANDNDPPDCPAKTNKQYAWMVWRGAANLPSMELVMKDFAHADFVNLKTDTELKKVDYDAKLQKLQKVAYYLLAWFNRYLLNDKSQDAKLLSSHPLGIPINKVLSAKQTLQGQPSKAFHSAAFIPGKIDCDDLVPCLQKVSAQTELSKPAPQMVLHNP